MDDSLVLEDVHFFNSGDGVNTKSLQGVLQSLVICGGGLMHRFLLPGKEQQGISNKMSGFTRPQIITFTSA